MNRRIDKVMMIMLGIALLAAPAMAQVLFSDDFSDGNRDGWYMFNATGKNLDTSSNYMETVSDTTFAIWGAAANFSAADLSEVGSSVNLSMDFQIMDDLGSRTISMGLYDSKGTQIITDIFDLTGVSDDSGYWLYNGGSSTAARYWFKGGYGTGLGNVNGSTSLVKNDPSPFSTADGIWHTFSLTLTRTIDGILIDQVCDEGLGSEHGVSTTDDSTNIIENIDQVAIQAITEDFAIDNVVVTYTAPPENPNPPVFDVDPIDRPNGTNGVPYGATIAGTATDADGDPISYSVVSGPAWLNIATNGNLSGTPGTTDEGLNVWTVSADDGFTNDTAILNITVVYTTNNPPVFSTNTFVVADGRTGIAYNGDLDGWAEDPDSDELTYTKLSGPAWLNIATNGILSGTPDTVDAGLNSWTVEVTDGLGGTNSATLEMTVLLVQTLFSDDFADNNRDGWYMTNTNATRDLVATNNTLAWDDPANTFGIAHAIAGFPAADLSSVGDTVRLTMEFQILENLGSRTIGMGLWDSQGTTFTEDVGDLGNGTNDVGYYIYDRDTRYWLKDSVGKGIGDINGSTSLDKAATSTFAVADLTWHTYDLTLERWSATQMRVTLVTDEGLATETILSNTSGLAVDSVDQVIISTYGSDYMIRNVQVTGIPAAGTTYAAWAFGAGLTEGVNDGYGQDLEPDGLPNLVEYALGSDPLVDDAAAFSPTIEVAADGGTNYLNYIYRRRVDYTERDLTYSVGSALNLTGPITSPTEEAGSGTIDEDFESVTNRVPTDVEDVQFMQLSVTPGPNT